jgi:atlastin
VNLCRYEKSISYCFQLKQIIRIDSENNQVTWDAVALEKIAANVRDKGAERIAIVSIMGAYRTGKSFLLDLFLRFLRSRTKNSNGEALVSDCSDSMEFQPSPNGLIAPSWLSREGDVILEGHDSDKGTQGFHWRGGMEKCTSGCWIWSEPFLQEHQTHNEFGVQSREKVAVLLLDSQGAFDSRMTKEQSATIFGLTAVLSSHQIYNVSKQLQEDSIENLHFFMECASSCVRLLSKAKEGDTKLFQHLEFLVRDWPNYETGWNIESCEKQMNEHLAQHFDHARDRTTPDSIQTMFERISCFGIPHPGLKINKVGWSGRIEDLDPEFIRFVDFYAKRTFSESLQERNILGKPLSANTLVEVVGSFVEAFRDLVPKGANLASAIAKSSNLMSKDQALHEFKRLVERLIGPETSKGVSDDEFAKGEKKARSLALDLFTKQTIFGPEEERDMVRDDLISELDKLRTFYESENRRRVESALKIFAGLSVLVGVLYLIDKISDFTCDWYSETCVRMSNALFLVYFTIVVAILTNAYLLYQSRGQAVTFMALIEMFKASVALFLEYTSSFKNIFVDLKEANYDHMKDHSISLLSRVSHDIRNGLLAIQTSVADALFSGKGRSDD